jgi:transcription factor S
MFCPKCGALLLPRKQGTKTITKCSCGYESKLSAPVELKEKIKSEEQNVRVVKDEDESLPLTDAECPKCKHKRAYYWLIQTRAGDEAETRFFKCEKCKHVWREY